MGCTSSAPNTMPPNTNTADKSIQFEEETNENPSIEVDVADIVDENRHNQMKLIASCDTNEEPVQLVRNNKSASSLLNEKDISANGHVNDSISAIEIPANTQNEIKIPRLELLMEKVFETNQHLNDLDNKVNESADTTQNSDEVESTEKNIEPSDAAIEPETVDNSKAEDENNIVDEETKEASPSQSQSSRATRWEALADIAAELPPSLAVDPVTGQIYQIALPKKQSEH